MTTLRSSRAIVGPAVAVRLHRVHRGSSVPPVPMSLEIRAGLSLSLEESLRVVDLGFRIRPWTGDGGRQLRGADGGEAGSIHEVRDVQDAGHHQERGEGRAG